MLAEFALLLPAVVVVVFVLVQLVATFSDYQKITDVARVAARQAAVTADPGRCSAASDAAEAAADPLDVTPTCQPTTINGGQATAVTVSYTRKFSLPFFPNVFSIDMSSTATERDE